MGEALSIGILVAVFLVGLALVPLGLPGLWVMVVAILAFGWLDGWRSVGPVTIATVLGLALLGELVEWWLGFRVTRRFGGSRRAGWGALAGGIVGAVVGVPVPLVGSVIGAFIGSFAGAAIFEYTRARRSGTPGPG
ncbi:MAG TPA: DUF456 domain-containing protein, partial [Longimicrobiales bacterium]|nr:DUF456 domain-containing protein [Longimicrobiales bacterium]